MLKAIRYEILRGIQCSAQKTITLPERPKRVALLLNAAEFESTKALIHHKTVFFDEPLHDYDWNKGVFRYYSHAAGIGEVVDVVLVYEDAPYQPEAKFDALTGKPLKQPVSASAVTTTTLPDANGTAGACVRFTFDGAVKFHIDVKPAKRSKGTELVTEVGFSSSSDATLDDAEIAASALLEGIRLARQNLHDRNKDILPRSLGVLSVQLQTQLQRIEQQKQRQDSSLEQMAALHPFANRLGLYDAADLIKSMTAKKKAA